LQSQPKSFAVRHLTSQLNLCCPGVFSAQPSFIGNNSAQCKKSSAVSATSCSPSSPRGKFDRKLVPLRTPNSALADVPSIGAWSVACR
jgi:hypothetical protein